MMHLENILLRIRKCMQAAFSQDADDLGRSLLENGRQGRDARPHLAGWMNLIFPEMDQSSLEDVADSSHVEGLSEGCPWNRRRHRALEK